MAYPPWATARLTTQQKADLIIGYIRKYGPSTAHTICNGTNPKLTWNQFEGGKFHIHHAMQVTLGEPFACDPTDYTYHLPDTWDDNLFCLARHLKSLRTYTHLVASNLVASMEKWEGEPFEHEIEDLKILVARQYEDFERILKKAYKYNPAVTKGRVLPAL